jgi:predicted ester cyclase
MAPGHVGHHSLVPKQPPSRELYKQYIVRTRTAFPDFHATIEEQIAEGDLVVTRWSVQGTHQGVVLWGLIGAEKPNLFVSHKHAAC